jgi:hypothetical protein
MVVDKEGFHNEFPEGGRGGIYAKLLAFGASASRDMAKKVLGASDTR